MINAFTVDVEDYFHVQAFADRVAPARWDDFESRVVESSERILRLLEEHQIRATFFVLGWVADRHPGLVRRIFEAGHEIGCHSFWHRLIYTQNPESFRYDLQQATRALHAITGEVPSAFRAPSFSITKRSEWALRVLVEEGYRIDSSIFPVQHDTYGMPNAEPGVHQRQTEAGSIWEVPPTVRCFGRFNLPVGGGGYLRLYPTSLSLRCLKSVNHRENRPFIAYVHPWELDPDQPRIAAPWRSRFRHYQNLRTTESKLRALLREFRFGPISELVRSSQATQHARQTDGLGTRSNATIVASGAL
jgi:polysaccharide deacetylase family protein (PEP-CTERM system associated)